MRTETWGSIARRVIRRVIEENNGADYKTFKKKLREAYPFGRREYFPYKAWCKEQKKALRTLFPDQTGVMVKQPINDGLFAPWPQEENCIPFSDPESLHFTLKPDFINLTPP